MTRNARICATVKGRPSQSRMGLRPLRVALTTSCTFRYKALTARSSSGALNPAAPLCAACSRRWFMLRATRTSTKWTVHSS
eukprot:scaffold1435_cov267-Pinguiococcus_pyrenoidosus.AAC.21